MKAYPLVGAEWKKLKEELSRKHEVER